VGYINPIYHLAEISSFQKIFITKIPKNSLKKVSSKCFQQSGSCLIFALWEGFWGIVIFGVEIENIGNELEIDSDLQVGY